MARDTTTRTGAGGVFAGLVGAVRQGQAKLGEIPWSITGCTNKAA